MTRPDERGTRAAPRRNLGASLADAVQAEIIAAGWLVGTLLGSEADLCQRYGVGRGTFREAARLLEHHQVARMQRGRTGGLVVTAPDAHSVTTALAVFFEYANPSLADVHTVRRVLELLAVQLAALNIGDEEIAMLRSLYDDERATLPDPHSAHLQHQRLHQVIAKASGNPALEVFVDALSRLIERNPASFELYEHHGAELEEQIRSIHRRIGDAVIAGNVAAAQRLMTRHLRAIEQMEEAQGGSQRRASGLLSSPEAAGRRADEVAWAIHDEIRDTRWPVGSVVGSQTDLMERYGVGRAVFREAVRLLEDHSVARMKKGPGGGLVTMAPDESAVVENVSLFLRYSGIDAAHLRAVRMTLELTAANRAATEPHHSVERLVALADVGAADSASFHLELAALAGNPVLSLFMKVLIELGRESFLAADPAGSEPAGSEPAGSDPAGSEPAGSDPAGPPGRSLGAPAPLADRTPLHTAIAEAVARRDHVLAQRLVLRDTRSWCALGATAAGTPAAAHGAAGAQATNGMASAGRVNGRRPPPPGRRPPGRRS